MNGPVVTALETAVYVIPTDEPEADGTLTWDKTTMVLVRARAGGEQGLGWSYASAAAQIASSLAAHSNYYPGAKVMQWNLTIQKQFGQNVVTLAYVGNLSRHLNYAPNSFELAYDMEGRGSDSLTLRPSGPTSERMVDLRLGPLGATKHARKPGDAWGN